MNNIERIGKVVDRVPDGQIDIKGSAYGDMVEILLNNGYELIVYADAYGDEDFFPEYKQRTFHIAFWKSDVKQELDVNKLIADVGMGA